MRKGRLAFVAVLVGVLALVLAPSTLATTTSEVSYIVEVTISGTVTAGPYHGMGTVSGQLVATQSPGLISPGKWQGDTDLSWSSVAYGGIPMCQAGSLEPPTSIVVTITGRPTALQPIQVQWSGIWTDETVPLTCNGITAPGGGLPVEPFIGTTGPTTFMLPPDGGTQTISGGLAAPGGGWNNTGTITITRALSNGKRFTDREKALASKMATNATSFENSWSNVGTACRALGPVFGRACSAIVYSVRTVDKIDANNWSDLAADPPRSDYTQVGEPRYPSVTRFRGTNAKGRAAAQALNAYLTNLAHEAGLTQAMLIAVERAQGAQLANAQTWVTRQAAAASNYARQLAATLTSQWTLGSRLRTALVAAGFRGSAALNTLTSDKSTLREGANMWSAFAKSITQ